jgi:hemoglobin
VIRKRHALQRARLVLSSAALLALAGTAVAAQQQNGADSLTLYERLGGYDFIAHFVDTAFPRVASDPQLARLFRGHSRDSQQRQRQLIVDVLCRDTGGPCIYIGRALPAVHEGLGITDADWRVFMGIIEGALRELAPPPDAQRDFLALFEERLRATVVLKE